MNNKTLFINQLIHGINQQIEKQVNAILHHPQFQSLEATWRNLNLLSAQMATLHHSRVKLKVFNLSFSELQDDLLFKHSEFDHTVVFNKTYTDTYDQPGGEPFNLIIGDYEFHHRIDQGFDHIGMLTEIAKIMSQSMTLWISAASAHLVGLKRWHDLKAHHQYEKLIRHKDYQRWQQFRSLPASQFITLVAPKVLLRQPYHQSQYKNNNHFFKEQCQHIEDYLWGNPAYLYASAILRCYHQTGWFLNIRTPMSQPAMKAEAKARYHQSSAIASSTVEINIGDSQERRLNAVGIIIARELKYAAEHAFFSHPSQHTPPRYDRDNANFNAHLSCQPPYLLCAARFSQTLKMILRDKVGSFTSLGECQQFLLNWIHQYCSANPQTSDTLHLYPLQDVKISFKENLDQPNHYYCITHIKPHCFIETIDTHLKLSTPMRMVTHKETEHV